MIVKTNNQHYKDIADAIRTKNGLPDTYKSSQMAEAIRAIGSKSTVNPKDINFYDYDGTLVYSYFLSDLPLTALPTPPDHSNDEIPLTSQGWNWSLEDINGLTRGMNIGAVYITTDGKTHAKVLLSAASGLAPTVYLWKSNTDELTIDWGDGIQTTHTNSGNFNVNHEYSTGGYYIIKIWMSSGNGNYRLGSGSAASNFFGGAIASYRQALLEVRLGNNILRIANYSFYLCFSLASVTIPDGVTLIGDSAFSSCDNLTFVVVPNSIASIGINVFNGCYLIASIAIPNGITSIGIASFNASYNLAFITIPSSIASIGASAFYGCYRLTSITIPSSITSIGALAFCNCFGMREYHFYSTSPPTLANIDAFNNIVSVCRIFVPAASLEAYKTATNWATYADYMVGE